MPSKPRTAPAATEPVDPLADLRETTDATEGPQEGQDGPQEPTGDEGRALASQEDWDAARAVMVAAWHADTTAMGFLHKGGRCGCHYIAGIGLGAVMPTEPDADPSEWPEGAPAAPVEFRHHQGA